jgi:hypothetical protein
MEPVEVNAPPSSPNDAAENEEAAPEVTGIEAPEARDVLLETPAHIVNIAIADLSRIYGEGHRGAIAGKSFAPSDVIQREVARAYVSMRVTQADRDQLAESGDKDAETLNFFTGSTKERPYEQCPEALGSQLHAALTGILIRDDEVLAKVISGAITEEGGYVLHGEVNKVHFADPADVYEHVRKHYLADASAEKLEFWTLDAFARLYGVVQSNASCGVAPFSTFQYGVGFFPGSVFFNHSCKPNAVATLYPGKLIVQALEPIEKGEEITLAYQELPVDLLTPAMVRITHQASGMIRNSLGCRCSICTAQLEAEAVALREAGLDPDAGRVVDVDMLSAWEEGTRARLQLDDRFHDLAMFMIRTPLTGVGVRAARLLRTNYDHFLTPPEPLATGEPGRKESFCADLAYVLSELYCRCVIHIPNYTDTQGTVHEQSADDFMWWTALYGKMVACSSINLPNSLTASLGARCYGALLACGWYTHQEEALPAATKEEQELFPAPTVGAVALATRYMPVATWLAKCSTMPQFVQEWKKLAHHSKEEEMPREAVFKALQQVKKHPQLFEVARRRTLLTYHQFAMLDEFVNAWVGLRASHVQIFNHTAFTSLVQKSYAVIDASVMRCNKRIGEAERLLQLRVALERQQQEAAAPDPATFQSE